MKGSPMATAVRNQPDHRRKLLSAIHVEKARRGLDDDIYRSIVLRVAGETSAKDCDIRQLGAILTAIRGQTTPAATGNDSPYIRKARALWKSLHSLGAIDDPSDKALAAFARRQTKIDALRWITPQIAEIIIEPLRDMCRRAGYAPPSNVKADQAAHLLIDAQLAILYPDGAPDGVHDWIAATPVYGVIAALGDRIRATR